MPLQVRRDAQSVVVFDGFLAAVAELGSEGRGRETIRLYMRWVGGWNSEIQFVCVCVCVCVVYVGV